MMRFPYIDTDDDRIEDGSGVPVESMKVFLLDEDNEEWVLQENSWEQGSDEEVKLAVFHLSVYCLMGVGDDIIVSNIANYPNPFTDSTSVLFSLNRSADVSVEVYTIAGRMIRVLTDSEAMDGGYQMGQLVDLTIYLAGTDDVGARVRVEATVVRIQSTGDDLLDHVTEGKRTGVAVKFNESLFRAGINYKFGS